MVCSFTVAKVSLKSGEIIDWEDQTLSLASCLLFSWTAVYSPIAFSIRGFFFLAFPFPYHGFVPKSRYVYLCLELAVLLKKEAQEITSLLISRILIFSSQLVISDPGC